MLNNVERRKKNTEMFIEEFVTKLGLGFVECGGKLTDDEVEALTNLRNFLDKTIRISESMYDFETIKDTLDRLNKK